MDQLLYDISILKKIWNAIDNYKKTYKMYITPVNKPKQTIWQW